MHAIRIQRHGGPEVLESAEVPVPEPGPGRIRVRLQAIGVNFIDVYQRTGLYPQSLPFVPGVEGAGVVDAVGPQVAGVRVGDRVAFAQQPGSYAAQAVIEATRAVHVPVGIGMDTAAALLLQGMTAHYLACDTFPLRQGHMALVHAGAGGVGLLLTQIAVRRGARVLATVSSEPKAELARGAGAERVVRYDREDFAAAARAWSGGRGVDVVYDSVAATTFAGSLASLRPRGMLALYGQSSGPVPPFDLRELSKGAWFVTRPTLHHYVHLPEELQARSRDLFAWLAEGWLRVRIGQRWPLGEAAAAHRALEGRATTGKVLLMP